MKYVLYEANGLPTPVLFPDHVPHDLAIIPFAVISAGFVSIDGPNITTYGKSESLGLESRMEDSRFIHAMLNGGAR